MSEQCIKEGNEVMTVSKVVNDEDRILIYDGRPGALRYHVIADIKEEVKVGDQIEYEPYGANFGWFVRVL